MAARLDSVAVRLREEHAVALGRQAQVIFENIEKETGK